MLTLDPQLEYIPAYYASEASPGVMMDFVGCKPEEVSTRRRSPSSTAIPCTAERPDADTCGP